LCCFLKRNALCVLNTCDFRGKCSRRQGAKLTGGETGLLILSRSARFWGSAARAATGIITPRRGFDSCPLHNCFHWVLGNSACRKVGGFLKDFIWLEPKGSLGLYLALVCKDWGFFEKIFRYSYCRNENKGLLLSRHKVDRRGGSRL
jgi:hypothetical protein